MASPSPTPAAPAPASPPPPYRQIRALYTNTTITVYQAYSAAIALPAVAQQNLSAAPEFAFSRMTWIKPSWCWMMSVSAASPPPRSAADTTQGTAQATPSRTRTKRTSSRSP